MIRNDTSQPAVVVIGAGPAGSSVAAACARRGHEVELLDRDRFPRPKVCGCCLADRGVEALRRAGLDDLLKSGFSLRTTEICTRGRRVLLPFHGSIVLSRETLDSALVDHAISMGASFRTRVRASVDERGQVRATDLDTGESCLRRPRAVIVADGLEGRALGEHPAFGWRIAKNSRVGAGITLEQEESVEDSPEPGLLSMLAGRSGYLGMVRLPDGRLDLAAALDRNHARREGGPAGMAMRLLLQDGRSSLAKAIDGLRWRTTPPLSRRRQVAFQNIACIGDSSGYVEPFTGEGMSWAIGAADELAGIVDRALAGGGSLEKWRGIHRRATSIDRLRCRIIARAARNPAVAHALIRTATHLPLLRERLADSASGVATRPDRNLMIGGEA